MFNLEQRAEMEYLDYEQYQCVSTDFLGNRCPRMAIGKEPYCDECLDDLESTHEEDKTFICDRCEKNSYNPKYGDICYECFDKETDERLKKIVLLDTDSEDELSDIKKEDFGIVSEEDINKMDSDDLREWSIEQDYKHSEEELIKNNKTLQLLRKMLNLLEKMKEKPMCKEEISIFNAYFDNLDAIRRNIIDNTLETNRRRKISDKLD